MFSPTIRRKNLAAACGVVFFALLVAIAAAFSFRSPSISAQDFPTVIGRIEGDDLEVATTTPAGVERDASPTVVASGSEVTLRSGRALLLLNGGGEISVCGPAHFKLLRASGAVTLALDYGRVHPSLETSDAFTIYTPTIVATPIAISGGYRDLTVGLEQSGEMCVLTARGAMRVEPQFSDQSLIVPQGGTVSLIGGQIDSLKADVTACSCDYQRARNVSPTPVTPPVVPARSQTPVDVGALAPPIEPKSRRVQNVAPPAAAGEPVYTVLMPPLSFNANSPEPPPDPSPETILLVREVRLRPTAEFRGHVNPAPIAPPAAVPPTPPPPPAAAPARPTQQQQQPGFMDRVRNFFRKLTSDSQSPCAGAGCNG